MISLKIFDMIITYGWFDNIRNRWHGFFMIIDIGLFRNTIITMNLAFGFFYLQVQCRFTQDNLRVESLNLSHCDVRDEGCIHVAQLLTDNIVITRLVSEFRNHMIKLKHNHSVYRHISHKIWRYCITWSYSVTA